MKRQFKASTLPKALTVSLALGVALSPFASAAAVLIDDDFSSSGISGNQRFRLNQVDLGWYKDNSSTPSHWTTAGGKLANPGTTAGIASEGSVAQTITVANHTTDTSLTKISVSFDYSVGAGTTLYFHLLGWKTNGTPAADEIFNNPQQQNGSMQNQGDTHFGDISIITGADPNGATGDAVAFAQNTFGTYTATFDLAGYSWSADESPGLTGSIGNITALQYLQVAFGTNMANADGTGAVSIDNLKISAIPEPSSVALLLGGLGMLTLVRRRA